MEELEPTVETTEVETSDEVAKLRAELAKQKAATDKATKEAAENKRALRARQSEEEAAAEEAKAQHEALMQELETLRKERAVASITAKVIPIVGDSEVAGKVAEYLHGAENVDAALTAIQKAWTAKEKALRLEYGKIPGPGVGDANAPSLTKAQLDAMSYSQRLEFATKHPDEYEKLLGR